jgi:hypothetical protein
MLIAARGLPVEKRSLFLQRVASDLELRRQSQKIDVDRAISVALRVGAAGTRTNRGLSHRDG